MNPDVRKLPPLPEAAAIIERTWRGSWFVGSATLSDQVTEHHAYTAEQMHAYALAALAAQADDDARWEQILDRATDRIVAAQGTALYGEYHIEHIDTDHVRLTTIAAPVAASPEVIPGTLDALSRLSISADHDKQWCNEHGMFHSVELRSPDCDFGDEPPAAPAAPDIDERIEQAGEILFRDWDRNDRREGGQFEDWRMRIRAILEITTPRGPGGRFDDAAVERAARFICATVGEDWDSIGDFARSVLMDNQRGALQAASGGGGQ